MKKIISLFAVFSVLMACASLSFAQEKADSEDYTGKTVILHTNDTHSRVDNYMGFAAVKYWKDYYEDKGANVLVLDAGDALHGMPFANLSEGENIITLMNDVGYDAMVPGNHDFNFGAEKLISLANDFDGDILACNITKDGSDETVFMPSAVYGNVGVIGIATPETATATNPENVEGYSFNASKLAQLVQKQIDVLKANSNVKYIVALGHLGIEGTAKGLRSTDVISNTSGIDLFIDGHSHSVFDDNTVVKDKDGKDVYITSAGEYLEHIGMAVLDGGSISTTLITETENFSRDEGIQATIDDIKANLEPLLNNVVVHTDIKLNGEIGDASTLGVRVGETNLGDLSADAVIYASGAQIGYVNGGGIRTSLPIDHSAASEDPIEGIKAGDITYGDLNTLFPFGNIVTVIDITGEQLAQLLEWGVRGLPTEAMGAFPQVSGISFEINIDNTDTVISSEDKSFVSYAGGISYGNGSRIENIKVAGEAIDLKATYSFATNDYIASGGDGFTMLKGSEIKGLYGAMDEAVVSYMEKVFSTSEGEKYRDTDTRITIKTSGEASLNVSGDTVQQTPEKKNTLTVPIIIAAVLSTAVLTGAVYYQKKKHTNK